MQRQNPRLKEVMIMNRTLCLVIAVLTAAGVLGLACCEVDAKAGKEIRDLIEDLEVGEPIYYENLTVIPVYSTRIRDNSHYSTLDEALDHGWLEMSELGGGSVPRVKVTNRSSNYIFIMGGEILTGCRQDRLVGRGVLLRPKARNVIIPVYCVEQGRWTYESETFYSKRNLGTSRLRAEGQKASDGAQKDIWDRVSAMCKRAGLGSGTSRFQEAYESDETLRRISGVEKTMERIPYLYPDAVGAVIGVGRHITSVDIFANPSLFKRMWPKLLRSSALAAFCDPAYGSIAQDDAIWFLRGLHDRRYSRRSAIDLGFEISGVDREMNVNALVYRDAVTHLAAFPEEVTDRANKYDENSERRIPVRRH
jgi:hypothetical protein